MLDESLHAYYALSHITVKGVRKMSDMTTLAVRLTKEDKALLMRHAIEKDLSASQIIRQLIRNFIKYCEIDTY